MLWASEINRSAVTIHFHLFYLESEPLEAVKVLSVGWVKKRNPAINVL